ncbi:MAG TPA: hypothetical protein VGG10_11720 [Rhizomicrobium sp.]|jgi:hypothetical protein
MKAMWAALAAMAILCAPAQAAPLKTWTLGDKTNSFTVAGLTLVFGEGRDADGAAVPGAQLKAAGTAPFTIAGQPGTNPVSAQWAIAKLDPHNPLPQVLFVSNSGGAHCCDKYLVVEKLPTGWTAFDLGQWNDGELPGIPVDVDGDKIPDIVLSDDRFLYAFDSYAASRSPPIVINVVNNAVQDVSKESRYRALYLKDMAKTKDQCAAHMNGVCAAYVADAARAGKFDEAWAFMLANYDKGSTWTYPTRCQGKRSASGDCAGKTLKPHDYPESLRWFLQDNGYIPKTP